GTPVTIDTNAAETLTTLVLNADDTNLDYTDEDGVTTQLDFTALVQNLETITTLVDNTDGTFTYTNEAGTPVTIDTNAAETLTTLVLNADDTNLDYTDEDGVTTQLDFTALVQNLETITTLVDNTDGTFTYTNEAGTPVTIDTNAAETLTTLVLNADDTNLDYTDEDGVTTQLDFTALVQNLETITTLVDNTDGTFTYTNEAGTPVTIDTNAAETLTTLVLNPNNTSLDYTDEDGVTTQLNFTALVQNLESQDISTDGNPGNISISNGSTINLNVDDADSDSANEVNTAFAVNGANLEITDSNGTLSVPLASIGSDDQTITDFSYDDVTNVLTITLEDGNTSTVNLAELSETVVAGTGAITVTDDGNGNYTVNSTDPDESITNEVNTAFAVNGANLEITDSNGTLSVPLASIGSDDQTITDFSY
ncbi:hypothetical protein IL45_02215, partial [Nonlabens ulvanivorans]